MKSVREQLLEVLDDKQKANTYIQDLLHDLDRLQTSTALEEFVRDKGIIGRARRIILRHARKMRP